MRLLLAILAATTGLMAQVILVDPDYAIPKQNPYVTAADLQTGEKIFRGQCSGCHGPRGEGGRGAVLAQPKLRRAVDDESLFRVILNGVNGTEMPGGYALTARETWQVAAYVRSLGRLPVENTPGDAQRGHTVYREKGKCAQCHTVDGEGGTLGPELTEIGARRSVSHLRKAILDPASELPGEFLQVRLTTKDGKHITGVRLNEDTFTIQVRDLSGRIGSFVKQDLKELQKDKGKTPMPSYRGVLSEAETDDLVAYLATLRGKP